MKPLKVLTVFGTRPEAVKMAPVVQQLAACPQVESHVILTAQHREMLDQVLSIFDIQPEIDLNLMKPNQTLAETAAEILLHLDPILVKLQPDWVLVQGDTTTVVAASMAAFFRQVRVGHIEAGLRTHDKWQPFPEEINRRISGVIADFHFAPTEHARQNLLREGISDAHIAVTGNTQIDALHQIVSRPAPAEVQEWLRAWGVASGEKRLILVTAHRRENFGKPLEDICGALLRLAEDPRLHIVYPVHLNPRVQETVYSRLGSVPNLTLTEPLDYLPMVHLEQAATLILTDSGGIQEEAAGLRKPALVLREKTERPEGVEAGVLRLVGSDPERIYTETRRLLDDPAAYNQMANAVNPFGDGHAAERILHALLEFKEQ